jgi:arylsulfatase A-like enzyme
MAPLVNSACGLGISVCDQTAARLTEPLRPEAECDGTIVTYDSDHGRVDPRAHLVR